MRANSLAPYFLLLSFSVLLPACGGEPVKSAPAEIPRPAPAPPRAAPNPSIAPPAPIAVPAYEATGEALMYSPAAHGQRTAGGEAIDFYGLGAAHMSLPLGAYLEVSSLDGKRRLVVRINDRISAQEGAVRLSYTAVHILGLLPRQGGTVRMRSLPNAVAPQAPAASLATTGGEYLQIAAFREAATALNLQRRLQSQFAWPIRIQRQAGLHKLQIGPIQSPANREHIKQRLIQQGYHDVFIATD